MATKNERTQDYPQAAEAGAAAAPAPAPKAQAMPALGTSCTVRVAAGVVLMNNETGARFEPEVDTPVTVTITLLRRLQDGDVTLVA